ncbi:cupin domain-containing protein [Streptomyces crystallinus]|uniref:Cupin type-2 domain-containing protein n=1 Tax=Streptomyces crystallinus TaxID=68191 RepID=A0ABP3RNZ8_9ACTN
MSERTTAGRGAVSTADTHRTALRNPVIVADTTGPADIYGVHGTAGLTHWKALASGLDLAAGWEAVEWASVPPGGVSGEHRHTRTEEIYFVLRGSGEIVLDGVASPIHEGSMVLTGVGTVHGLRNTGATDLDWLVIEIRSPHTAHTLRTAGEHTASPARPDTEETLVNARLHDLRAEKTVDPAGVFTGPLRQAALRSLEPGGTLELRADGVEHTVFVTSGSGWAQSDSATVELSAGTSVTLPLGTEVRLGADKSERLEFFHAELTVPAAASPEHAR